MTMEHEGASGSHTDPADADATFGELLRKSQASKHKANGLDGPDDDGIIRAVGGGGMEYSFNPSDNKKADKEERTARRSKIDADRAKKSELGVGMQKGVKEAEVVFAGEEGAGRQRKRKPQRSASNTAVRRLTAPAPKMSRKR